MFSYYKVKFWYPHVKMPFFITVKANSFVSAKKKIARDTQSRLKGVPNKFELIDKSPAGISRTGR